MILKDYIQSFCTQFPNFNLKVEALLHPYLLSELSQAGRSGSFLASRALNINFRLGPSEHFQIKWGTCLLMLWAYSTPLIIKGLNRVLMFFPKLSGDQSPTVPICSTGPAGKAGWAAAVSHISQSAAMLNMQAAEMPAMLSAHLTLVVEFK